METNWDLFEKIETSSTHLKENEATQQLEKKCYSCGSTKIEYIHFDERFVCQECGVVLCIIVNEESTSKEDSSNINIYLPKSSLGTSICGNQHMRLRVVNGWLKWIYKEKAFFEDKKIMEEKCYNANYNQSILDNALHLYKKVSNTNKIIRGKKRKGVMAACIYYGAQMQNQSHTTIEISNAFDIDRNYLTKGCKLLNELITIDKKNTTNSINSIIEFTERYCSALLCLDEQKQKANMIALNIIKLGIATNFQPSSVAASILLILVKLDIVTDDIITIDKINSLFKISKATILKAFKVIKPWIEIISNTSMTESCIKNNIK